MSVEQTKELYWAIYALTLLFAFLSQNRFGKNRKFYKFPFLLTFLIPWFFFAFNDISNDYEEYSYIFETCDFTTYNTLWIEPGYALLNAFIKLFVAKTAIAIVIIKSIVSLIIFKVIYDYREKVSIFMSVLAYMSLMYLDSFCMIRIHLAAAILLLAIDLYDNKDKVILPIVLYAVSCTIHYSSVSLIPVVLSYWLFRKIHFNLKWILLFIFIILIVRYFAVPLMTSLLTSVTFLMKYNYKYGEISSTGSGLMQYIYHLPAILALIVNWKSIMRRGDSTYLIALVMIPFSLFYSTMGYTIEAIGRTFVYYMFVWMIMMAKYSYESKGNVNDIVILPLCIIILIFRFNDYMVNALHSAGIEKFHLII